MAAPNPGGYGQNYQPLPSHAQGAYAPPPTYEQSHYSYSYQQPPPPQYSGPYQPGAVKSNHGLTGTLMNIGKEVGSVVGSLVSTGAKTLNRYIDHPLLKLLQAGNVVQLVSRVTGRSLQILQAQDGRLVLDGLGGEGHQFFNTHFTVMREEDCIVQLHNNFNYLAIINGTLQLHSAGPGNVGTGYCRFQAREVPFDKNFIVLESAIEKGRFMAVCPNGVIKSALATSSSDRDTHFGVRLIFSPHGMPAGTKVK
ncbi:uncharacterized protein LOC143225445 isoform X2 [Tachypleus tridentatus]|uniref:uncharacterized protein LOC143225445 isoform X2 n=1 Tax=Tachypleus tridentatus TaxID=6853 RepID=UPI003FD2E613